MVISRNFNRRRALRQNRHGFTLIELLVVISIIAVLAALITPAVQSARRAARNLECKNNLSNLGKALANFESGTGYLPYFHDGTTYGSWIRQILPYLDAQAIHEGIQSGTVNPANIYLKVLACPDDETALKVDGQTSYVANTGYMEKDLWIGSGENLATLDTTHAPNNTLIYDWNSTEDVKISIAAGVFHRPAGSRRMSSQLINSGDGNQFTIWASENIQASEWYGGLVRQNGFGANVDISGFNKVTGGAPALELNFLSIEECFDESLPNRQISASSTIDGQFPRPSSRHVGTVNMLYADGRVQSMAESIAKDIFLRLITSEGTRNGQVVLDDSAF